MVEGLGVVWNAHSMAAGLGQEMGIETSGEMGISGRGMDADAEGGGWS